MSAREGGVTAERCNKAIKVWNGGGTSLVDALGPSRQGKGEKDPFGVSPFITKTGVDVRGLRETCLNLRRL